MSDKTRVSLWVMTAFSVLMVIIAACEGSWGLWKSATIILMPFYILILIESFFVKEN